VGEKTQKRDVVRQKKESEFCPFREALKLLITLRVKKSVIFLWRVSRKRCTMTDLEKIISIFPNEEK
jgi:hypothetical protein